jgi:hypothetical protein
VSSTKRGGQRSPADNYPTPNWCTHRLLDRLAPRYPEIVKGRWLEPGAGEGNILRGITEWFALTESGHPGPILDACELRGECEEPLKRYADIIQIGDYFKLGPPPDQEYTLIGTNPPFSLAMEFILRSLKANTRFVTMLLRLNYVGSQDRHEFFTTYVPDLYVLPNRPSFKGTGEVDSIEYAWFFWDKQDLHRSRGRYEMLDLTPLAVRKAEHQFLKESGLFPKLPSGRKKKLPTVKEFAEAARASGDPMQLEANEAALKEDVGS